MGAFTSAVLLGGGRVKTIPVLIQEKMIQSTDYAMGAALSTTLLVLVFALNVGLALAALRARRRSRR
jgi:ABC-type spermidine/putrescine transport system permease subunit I